VSEATAGGARLIAGGSSPEGKAGNWLEPTILADVRDEMKCQCDEIFGPIMACRSFATVDEAFERANDSELGIYIRIPVSMCVNS